MASRGRFNSRFATVMAMAGSAVGLGNIWRFPYMVGEHGGAAFIIVYIICCLLVSLPIFFAESIIGKTTRKDTFGALEALAPKSKNVGYVAILASFIILSFYSVVGGWSFNYLLRALGGSFNGLGMEQAREVFAGVGASPVESVSCMLVFLGLTAMIVVAGVDKGIGRFSKISIPVLFVMVLVIAGVSLRLPGAEKGVEYLVRPDFGKLDGPAIAAALGQSFFSLSLGVGSILTYSSYMKEKDSVLFAGGWTALFDTLFAIVAGFAIMPAVVAAGIEPAAGPSLVFETLPVIFSRMGVVLPVIFFLAILIAALSSSISMLEVVVAWMVDQKGMRRSYAVLAVFLAAALLGSACAV
ncbi:MAG: sodium-dependent transporter, partial [Bacteroidales bacterium]|nr:sodium-dependent transporter [Bacteroidales bacterium]